MTNCTILNEKLQKSGFKKGHLANKIGISRQALHKKLNGETEFKIEEVTRICKLLDISASDREAIFFNS